MASNDTNPPPFALGLEDDNAARIERRSWRVWVLTVSVAITLTLGLGGILLLGHFGTIRTPWSLERWQPFLIEGLAILFLIFVLDTTREQRRLALYRRRLWSSRRAADERVRRNVDRLVAIMQVSRVMGSANDPDTVFETIAHSCLETFQANRVSLMLLDRETGELVVRAASGHDDLSKVLGVRIRMGQGVAGWVAQHRRPLVLGGHVNPMQYVGFTPKNDDPHAAIVVPIVLRDELIGVLNVTSFVPGAAFHDEDVQALMVFGEHAGICCRHAEQTEWMRQTIQRLDSALTDREDDKRSRAA